MPLVTRNSSSANIFRASTEPDQKGNGNVWMDTNDTPASLSTADGTNYVAAKVKINSNTAVVVGALL